VVEVLKRLTEGLGDRLVMLVQGGTRPTEWRPETLGVQVVKIDQSCLGPKWLSLGGWLSSSGGYITAKEEQQLRKLEHETGASGLVDTIETTSSEGLEEGEAGEEEGGDDAEVQGAAADVEDVLSTVVTPWVKQELSRWLDRARQLLKVRRTALYIKKKPRSTCRRYGSIGRNYSKAHPQQTQELASGSSICRICYGYYGSGGHGRGGTHHVC
jgi:hypothetical protein